jgi:hypothetical protein
MSLPPDWLLNAREAILLGKEGITMRRLCPLTGRQLGHQLLRLDAT